MGLDESRAREGARRGHPSRHGVAVAPRRQTSACAHVVAPRGDVAKLQGNTRGAERAGARRVAGGAGKRRRHGENREGGVRGWR